MGLASKRHAANPETGGDREVPVPIFQHAAWRTCPIVSAITVIAPAAVRFARAVRASSLCELSSSRRSSAVFRSPLECFTAARCRP